MLVFTLGGGGGVQKSYNGSTKCWLLHVMKCRQGFCENIKNSALFWDFCSVCNVLTTNLNEASTKALVQSNVQAQGTCNRI